MARRRAPEPKDIRRRFALLIELYGAYEACIAAGADPLEDQDRLRPLEDALDGMDALRSKLIQEHIDAYVGAAVRELSDPKHCLWEAEVGASNRRDRIRSILRQVFRGWRVDDYIVDQLSEAGSLRRHELSLKDRLAEAFEALTNRSRTLLLGGSRGTAGRHYASLAFGHPLSIWHAPTWHSWSHVTRAQLDAEASLLQRFVEQQVDRALSEFTEGLSPEGEDLLTAAFERDYARSPRLSELFEESVMGRKTKDIEASAGEPPTALPQRDGAPAEPPKALLLPRRSFPLGRVCETGESFCKASACDGVGSVSIT